MSEEPGSERLIAGRYRLLTPLGEGGMGTVWRARDEVLHREVAVKEVRAPHGLAASDVERMYARLEREAWAAARVANRNVVTVYDVATQDGRPWIVMEIVRGISLAELLDAEGPLEPARAAHIGAEVLSALRAAHEAGVLHRDVKPANVLMSNDGRVVLTDFGIATVEGTSALTMTGEVIGSPEFLAPERALGRTPGPESDLWSLGVLLYAAVEGNSPFRHDTPLSTLRAIVDEELPAPRRAGPLAPVIEGLLRKDPAERLPADRAEQDLRLVAAGGTPQGGTLRSTPPSPFTPYPPTVSTPSSRSVRCRRPRPRPAVDRRSGDDRLAGAGPQQACRCRPRRRCGGTRARGRRVDVRAAARRRRRRRHGRWDHQQRFGDREFACDSAGDQRGEQRTAERESQRERELRGPGAVRLGHRQRRAHRLFRQLSAAGRGRARVHRDHHGRAAARDRVLPLGFEGGELSGQTWKTLDFPSGGGKSKQDKVILSTYAESGTYRNSIAVEVRDPVTKRSDSVPFSVTCETETPTGRASPSPSSSE